jgi:hypothetical protein
MTWWVDLNLPLVQIFQPTLAKAVKVMFRSQTVGSPNRHRIVLPS